MTAQRHSEATAQRHSEAAAQRHSEAAAQPHGNTMTAQRHSEATAQPHSETTAQSHSETTAQRHSEATAQPHGEAMTQPRGQATDQPHGEAMTQPHGQATDQPQGEMTAQPHGQATAPATRQRRKRTAMRAALLTAAAAGATALLAGCGANEADPLADCPPEDCVVVGVGEPIYVGLLLNEGSASGDDTAGTVKLAVDNLDGEFDGIEGSIQGHDVVLLESPESCSSESGIEAAKLLLDQPDLIAVIGTTCSAAAYQAAVPILSDAKVLTVSSTNTSPQLTDIDSRQRFYFRTAINDLIQAAVVADFATAELKASKVAALSYADAYSEPMAEAFLARSATLGAEVLPQSSVERASGVIVEDSLAAAINELVAEAPQFIFLPMAEEACIQSFQAIKAQPALAATTVLVSEACQRPGFAAAVGDLGRGTYASGPDFEDLQTNPYFVDEFLPAYQRYVADRPPLVSTAASFDAANLVLSAIRQASTPLPGGRLLIDRMQLREAMVKVTGYPGLSGLLDCTPLGDCVRSARVSVYQEPQWPVLDEASTPVFTQTIELTEVITNR